MRNLKIILVVLNISIVIYCLPYCIEILKGKTLEDVWYFGIPMFMLDIVYLPIVLFVFFKGHKRLCALIFVTSVIYTLFSLLGTKIPPFAGVVLPIISSITYYMPKVKLH